MADDRSPAQRSQTMRQVRSRDTSCEVQLRRCLHRLGLRYSLQRRLPGSPDIVFVRARVAVFVDGCYWHGCPEHCRMPSSNRDYWTRKIERNRARDRRVDEELGAMGWRVVRVWEHEVQPDAARAAQRIARIVRSRQARAAAPGAARRPAAKR